MAFHSSRTAGSALLSGGKMPKTPPCLRCSRDALSSVSYMLLSGGCAGKPRFSFGRSNIASIRFRRAAAAEEERRGG